MQDDVTAPDPRCRSSGNPPDERSTGRVRALVRAIRLGRAGLDVRERERRTRLADLVAFARRHSTFYAERYRGLPERIDDVRDLPPITKSEAMESFDEWVTDPQVDRAGVEAFMRDPDRAGEPFLGRYLAMRTSGSTGGKALFVHDPAARAAYDAAWAIRGFSRWIGVREIAGLARRGFRSAEVLAVGDHFGTVAYSRFGRGRARRRDRVVSVLDPLADQVAALNAHRPGALAAYPSTLVLLARERAAGRLTIDPVLLLSVSECLDPWARAEVEAAFGRPVRNVYAAAEHPTMAFDCREGRLHLDDADLFLEPVDDDLRPVPPGTASTGVLLTNLANRVQPVIRYLLTDTVVVEPGPCPCGGASTTVRVEGRRIGILSFTGSGGGTVVVTPMALMTVGERIEGLARYQIVQSSEERLRVHVRAAEGYAEDTVWTAFRDALARYLSDEGADDVAIDRAGEPPRPDPASGKFHKFRSEIGEGWAR